MSLNSFKETLKPCKISSSSLISACSQLSSSSRQFYSSINTRKPPKSSLSRTILFLEEDSVCFSQTQSPSRQKRTALDDQIEDIDGDEEKQDGFKRRNLDLIKFDHKGPYDPLVLSSTGDAPKILVPASINCQLLEHQREGVKFLYNLYKNNHGGVLGDDMGLGKTIQTIAFLSAVLGKDEDSGNSISLEGSQVGKRGCALIICPASIIYNWETEFSSWATISVSIFHGANCDLIIDKLQAGVKVLITSFETYRIKSKILSDIPWEIVIIDEAHRLKNEKSKLYKACLEIKTRKRYGLTGTIMQNKIMELFNLFDWVVPGCLGTREHFREFYDEPLKHGQRSTAPQRFVTVANERKQQLVAVLGKYLLRRTKEETIGHLMMGKEDNIIFCAMSELQNRVYQRILKLPDVQCLINKDLQCSCGSPLTQVECCQRIVPNGVIWPYLHRDSPEGCDSCPFCLVLPCLVKLQQVSNHLELIKPNPKDDPDKQRKDAAFASAVFGSDIDLVGGNAHNESFLSLSDVQHCGKMRALDKQISSWVLQGDKILLFSYSVRMLGILEKFLVRKGYCFSRLDGSTPTGVRQFLVDDFNASASKQVFLISTRAGGLGLNLATANRVVIFDPNWNPAQDLQAQDRSFRFGQKRHVVVFRLLAAGSVEELIYSRQVYKQQLSNIAVSGKMERRYFEGVQDSKEFQGELFGISNLFRDLSDKLFTCEIIELHENQGQENRDRHRKRRDLSDLGSYVVSSHKETEVNFASTEDIKLENTRRNLTISPVLEECGVVHTHRNEDIVNCGHGNDGKRRMDVLQDNESPSPKKRKPGMKVGTEEKENDAAMTLKMRKRAEFSRVAEFMGMGDVDFSRWLISLTPAQQEKVLHDYKRRDKIPDD